MKFTPNALHEEAREPLELVRDCVAGEPRIKAKRERYLTHPGAVLSGDQQIKRYERYIKEAEFDGFPSKTLSAMIGKMKAAELQVELPSAIDYLEQDSDGNGSPLTSLVESCYTNTLQAKFHLLLAEMPMAPASEDGRPISVAAYKELNIRPSIKQYSRESLIDWDTRIIRGAKQLSLLIFRETFNVRDANYSVTEKTQYLVLGLDELGHYYQERYIDGENSGEHELDGDRVYPKVANQELGFIPVEVVADVPLEAAEVPQGMGFLYDISTCAVYRYQTSAKYKESMLFGVPTLFASGAKSGDAELFADLNGGRTQIAMGNGVVNVIPQNQKVESVSNNIDIAMYERYIEMNERKAKALGAAFDTSDSSQKTATASSIDDANQTAAMSSIVASTEDAIKRMALYCGMFMGLYAQKDIESHIDDIELNLYDKFGFVRMTPEEQNGIISIFSAGLISKEEAIKILEQGGVTVSAINEIMGKIENESNDPAPDSDDKEDAGT